VTRLDSWKEIATFLKRGLRTVQRWEREEGMPVHRLAHAKRGTVYADPAELTAWWESRRMTIDAPAAAPTPAAPASSATASASDTPLQRVTGVEAVSVYLSLSSDGRLLAYISDRGQDGGPPQVWLQQVGGESLRLTTGLRECMDAAFSADDTRVLFTAADGDGQLAIFDVPTLGGAPRRVKRAARSPRMSPDGRWLMWLSLGAPDGFRVARIDGAEERAVAPDFMEPFASAWSPSSDRVLVLGRADARAEPDWWLATLDGAIRPTGIAAAVRRQGLMTVLPTPFAWVGDAVVFGAVSRQGVGVFRQRFSAETAAPIGDAERLSPVSDFAWFPAAATSGRLAFAIVHPDMNLWSIAIDEQTGAAFGPLRRLTPGPGIQTFPCTTADGRYLFHASARAFRSEILRRDLDSAEETRVPIDAAHAEAGYPAISPSGRQLAYAPRGVGPDATRPVYVLDLAANTTRLVSADSGGRPRQWIDERFLVIETFGTRPTSILVLDTATGERRELVSSRSWALANPRVSPDGRWIAFDATPSGGLPRVFAAPIAERVAPPESSWLRVAVAASHPFWSRDGQLLYYLTTTPYLMLRGEVRARRFAADLPADGDSMPIATFGEAVVPVFLNGTAPVAAPDQIVLVLGDYRGDVWLREV
jgi:Tol biopolymer transport system component